jgi:hypothetical protein
MRSRHLFQKFFSLDICLPHSPFAWIGISSEMLSGMGKPGQVPALGSEGSMKVSLQVSSEYPGQSILTRRHLPESTDEIPGGIRFFWHWFLKQEGWTGQGDLQVVIIDTAWRGWDSIYISRPIFQA